MKITSTSIRRLHLSTWISEKDFYLNGTACSALANLPLGRQCEVLFIRIEDRSDVFDLIKTMSKLRILICHCRNHDRYLSENKKHVEWLKAHLPSTFSVQTIGLTKTIVATAIWIDK
ncbi:unnamed protein product [Rotaria sp. Silwood1]|nr:unnamed protein product [Rotaria sp. Silwood1]